MHRLSPRRRRRRRHPQRPHPRRGDRRAASEQRRPRLGGHPARAWREIGLGAQILKDLGVTSIRLLATRDRRYVGLDGFGIVIDETEILEGGVAGHLANVDTLCSAHPDELTSPLERRHHLDLGREQELVDRQDARQPVAAIDQDARVAGKRRRIAGHRDDFGTRRPRRAPRPAPWRRPRADRRPPRRRLRVRPAPAGCERGRAAAP